MEPQRLDLREIDPKSLALPVLAFTSGAILGLMGVKSLVRGVIAGATILGLVRGTERLPAPAARRTRAQPARRRGPTRKSA